MTDKSPEINHQSSAKVFLIIDDEPDICWTLEHILRKREFMHQKALNGQNALELMKTQHFQMVFLDAKLPDMEGLELARCIRNIDPGVPIVLISGYFYQEDAAVQKALQGGLICSFISKPFNHDKILGIIDTMAIASRQEQPQGGS